ncbi:aminotransferase family protein-like protein [Annulohypoxylon maeteangense]|uniref:aminotransferase family protein-like protein n=1 Tax=Annulohypoxylon maeteangense TaxID=1927788 RepID=UPI0020081957|nr:aminotransferase family protein-like protein [Annulohypoxylon maeteangense]KAI0887982.1 aminotransferase family protein-like protein [Annulohypoxylon maeteangense]
MRKLRDEPTIVAAAVPFGRETRQAYFNFAASYIPLNHGSFGAFPSCVRDYQRRLQCETEARPDTFIRFTYPRLLREARDVVAPLLGAETDEVVFVPNALTAVNTVLRNLTYQDGDVILYFSTIYDACLKTIESLEETTRVRGHSIELVYPIENDEILDRFRAAITEIQNQGRSVKLAMFDTILTFPGVRFPWEDLVSVCKEYGILSCIDGAHGIGHIDLRHLSRVGPDFFISNCYKWFMVPRGCAVLYVPYRNQALIRTTYPTAEGYQPTAQREMQSQRSYFVNLFEKVSTIDTTPYICVIEASKFREQVCGGEKRICDYCINMAKEGGELMATILGTDVLENNTGTLRSCCFTNVRLPLEVTEEPGEGRHIGRVPVTEAKAVADWITIKSVEEFDTFIATRYYAGAFWVRISSQIYLDRADFEWAAHVLLDLCNRVRKGIR